MSEVLAFTIISGLLVISPGPNGVLIVKTVSTYGKKFAYANMLGLFIATFIHGALSIFGLSALILQSAELFMILKLVGASYLLYIGLKTIYYSFKKTEENISVKNQKKKKTGSYLAAFSEGFLTQILNPKVSMFYLAAFPQFVDFANSAYVDAFSLVLIHASIQSIWFFAFTNFLYKIKKSSKESSRVSAYIQRVSGAIFVMFAGLLLSQENAK